MKPNFYRFSGFIILILSLAISSANAQEEIPGNEIPDINSYPELQEEKPLLFEPDKSVNTTDRNHQGKEQLIVPKSGKSKSGDSSRNSTKPEDDALSFNFLYYIIQKFKISDIVEQ